MTDYKKTIIELLLKKYYKRKSIYKDAIVNRRIELPMYKILKDYSEYNVDLQKKNQVNKDINDLVNRNLVTAKKLKLSEDYEKVYLCVENIENVEKYANETLGIIPRSFAADEITKVIDEYSDKGVIVHYYAIELRNIIENSSAPLDSNKEKDIFKILSFLEGNKQFLYLREASMLIFGDSKYLENNRKQKIATILYDYFSSLGEDVFEEENLFERFNVYDTDQEICIKGPIIIEFQDEKINLESLNGGVSFSNKDITQIKKIIVNSDKVITVENKTSFLRMNDDNCYVFLSGYATKTQIAFIKKLINENKEKTYMHFGDIDAGGFWIHKKLCEQTGMNFELFHMGKEDLENINYKNCLKELTESDLIRLIRLSKYPMYTECIEYMIQNSIKLEQEIISLTIGK